MPDREKNDNIKKTDLKDDRNKSGETSSGAIKLVRGYNALNAAIKSASLPSICLKKYDSLIVCAKDAPTLVKNTIKEITKKEADLLTANQKVASAIIAKPIISISFSPYFLSANLPSGKVKNT